jgi:hypothetical protein
MTEATPPVVETPPDTGASATPAPAAAAAPNPAPASQPPAVNTDPSKTSPDGTKLPESVTGEKPVEPVPFKLPDEFKDKPWASKIKTAEDLYKQIDNLTSLVGKKVVVPDLAKATDAEREEYYAQTRPKDAAEYQFGDSTDPLITKGMADSLMKNGVSAVQANAIIKDYQAAEKALLAAQYDPAGIQAAMEPVFGKDWQTITGQTKLALDKMMSPEDSQLLDNLPNSYMSLVYRTLGNVIKAVDKVTKDYGMKESAAHILAGGSAPAVVDMTVKRDALRGEIAKMIHRPHTEQEVMAKRKELADTYINDPRLQQKG